MLRNGTRNLLLAVLCAAIGACASVPFDYPKTHSDVITDTSDTSIAQSVAKWTVAHDGQSGFYPLIHGNDALGARLRLLEAAERSVDVQYFLMKEDIAGRIFSAALLQAADRGVRIRFLLDDVFTTISDESLTHLNQHENIEVRLYNPIARGGIFYLNFLADFKRANRRMHNKSLTVDNRITIVGGRNIADEYFELRHDAEFLDFDVVAIGDVATDVSEVFNTFWNHVQSVPMEAFDDKVKPGDFMAWRTEIDEHFKNAEQSIYLRAINSEIITSLVNDEIPLHPAGYAVITDDPDKLINKISDDQRTLVNYLAEVAAKSQSEIILVTPYFVPQEAGMNFWRSLSDRGIRVVVITNSLASNNHIAVHSGYSRHRRDIIEAGIELYEARVNAVRPASDSRSDAPEVLTLHTKAVIIDREMLFAGSLNLDPRSIDINSEMGILINAPTMVAPLANLILDDLAEFAYRVEIDDRNKLTWRGHIDGTEVIETHEPQSSLWRRTKAFFLKIVPDSQL